MYKAIAKAGHICYASEKEGDEEVFVQRCISLGHMRPLEFGTVYLKIPGDSNTLYFYSNNPYSIVETGTGITYYYITTNYRVLVENNCVEDLYYWCEPTEFHALRHCILWEHIGRDTADEFRTHCKISSLMQSTRYCAYNKDKFNNEITCMKPENVHTCDYYAMNEDEKEMFRAFEDSEKHYMTLMNKYGWTAERARKVLPLDLATVFIQCAFEEDWDHFFDLRLFDKTGPAHPDAKEICNMIYESYKTTKQNN